MKRFLMALVGVMLAFAGTQISAQANTLGLGDVTNATKNGGGLTVGTGATVDYDVTFSISAASNVAVLLANVPDTSLNIGGFTVSLLQGPGGSTYALSGALGGPFTFSGLLAAGDYLLHVGGTATGSFGGVFQATVSAAAVTPIPGALLLFVTALGGMAGFTRLRRRGAAEA